MNIEITIGGYSAPWRLLGAGSTIRWFAKQPWFNFQEPIVIHIPGQHQEEVFDLLRCEVRRVAEGDVHIVCLQPLENAWGTFTKWLDTSATTPRKLAEALAECARFCPRLFVIEPVADATIWMDDLSLLLDITQKLPDAVPFGIILTAAGSMPPPLSVPLGAGWPEFHHQDRDERIAWAAYLHERVAWHAAGSIDRVDSLSHRIGAISVGADRDLETALGLDADEAFAVLGGPVRNDLLTSTRTLSGHSNLTIPRGLSGQSRVVSRPAPWLARALLRAKPDHPERRYLASLTVCRPLADRLLGQCQDMEQRCRDRLLPQLPDNLHDQWVSSRYAKYKARQSAEYIYAPGELLDLQSEWEFADFESIIKASNLNKREGDIMHELRILRNILAHGQAIGWKATTTIERLEYALFRHK